MKYLSRSRNWRWPGVWSISETSRAGWRARNAFEGFDHVGRGNLAAQMGLVFGAQQARDPRPLDRVGEHDDLLAEAAAPISYSSVPTRNESNTVVIPAAAICAS